MSHTDPIADMLTRIRNANKALHAQVEMPSSATEGRVGPRPQGRGLHRRVLGRQERAASTTLVIELKYTDGRRRVISQVKRISKPGRRIYAKKDNLPKVLGGLGMAVISTSRGLMTAREAQRLGVGGEVVCFVW